MLLSIVEEISSINHMKSNALSSKMFLFKYRRWTCKTTEDYIAVCIAICIVVNVYVHVYICVHIYMYMLAHQYISLIRNIWIE